MESVMKLADVPLDDLPVEASRREARRKRKRRRGNCRLCIVLALAILITFIYILKNMIPPSIEAGAAVVMEADTGRVLYSHNADEPLPPASMSKMMTGLLVLDAVKSGNHHWKEPVRISRYAAKVPGSGIGMAEGEHYTLKQLFDALVVHSANDAAVAVAEHLAGSETDFAADMNRKAREIGLSPATFFANASGLSSGDLRPFREASTSADTVMTARDAASLARWLLSSYPDVTSVTRLKDVNIPHRNKSLHTTNLMLPGEAHAYPGSDGLKTGYTRQAGYCFTGTAEREGSRLISVVMGTDHPDVRFTETRKLLDYGFRRQLGLWDTIVLILG